MNMPNGSEQAISPTALNDDPFEDRLRELVAAGIISFTGLKGDEQRPRSPAQNGNQAPESGAGNGLSQSEISQKDGPDPRVFYMRESSQKPNNNSKSLPPASDRLQSMLNPILAVAYYRVSSEEQAMMDLSIPAQRKAVQRWAAMNGVKIIAEFVDEGQSAYAPVDKRPGFLDMMSFCGKRRNKGDIKHILVHKLDRFSRYRDESVFSKAVLKREGVTVKSVTEEYDPETPHGFLFEGIIEVINQFYSMNLARETLKGMGENAERGNHNGGRTPYGYRLETTEEHGRRRSKLVPGPSHEVETVKLMFNLATTHGWGGKSIARELNRKRIASPRGAGWGGGTVLTILNNPVYVGDIVWRKRKTIDRTKRRRSEPNEVITRQDCHPALVDRATFEKWRALSSERAFATGDSPGGYTEFLLGRLIHCDCGGRFSGKAHRYKTRHGEPRESRHYYCTRYLQKGPEMCKPYGISAEWADEAILSLVHRNLCVQPRLQELEGRVRKRLDERFAALKLDPGQLAKTLEELDRGIANYYRAIATGLEPEVCLKHIKELQERRESVEERAQLVEQEDLVARATVAALAEVKRFAGQFGGGFNGLPLGARRQIVTQFVERIELTDREKLKVILRLPSDTTGVKRLVTEGGKDSGNNGGKVEGGAGGAGGVFPSGTSRGANLFPTQKQNLLVWRHEEPLPPQPRFSQMRFGSPGKALWHRYRASSISSDPTATEPDLSSQHNESCGPNGASCGPTDPSCGPNGASCGPDQGSCGPNGASCGPTAESRRPRVAKGRLDPWVARRESLRGHLARARRWQKEIDAGLIENAAAVAARDGLTRARVSQLMGLLTLAPAILEEIEDPARSGPLPAEHVLRKLIHVYPPREQVSRFRRLIAVARQPDADRSDKRAYLRLPRGSFQHQFAKARELMALWQSGRFRSLRELGDEVGFSPERVGQLMSLLQLAPEIIKALDVPRDQVPKRITSGEVRRLARLRDHEEQLELFRKLRKDATRKRRVAGNSVPPSSS